MKILLSLVLLVLTLVTTQTQGADRSSLFRKKAPPLPPFPEQTSIQSMMVSSEMQMQSAQEQTVSSNMFVVDYWGPFVTTTNSGVKAFSPQDDGNLLTFNYNYLGVRDHGNFQTSSWEIVLAPNRNPASSIRPHKLSFRLGVLGGATEKMSVYFGGEFDTNLSYLTNVTGIAWPSMFDIAPTNWKTFLYTYTPAESSNVNIKLRFTYTTGNVTSQNSGANAGGIDYLAWESHFQSNDPITLRIEGNAREYGPFHGSQGVFGELPRSMHISWQKYTNTTITVPGTMKLHYATNFLNPEWVPINGPGYFKPVHIDPTGLRYKAYFYFNGTNRPEFWWHLRPQ